MWMDFCFKNRTPGNVELINLPMFKMFSILLTRAAVVLRVAPFYRRQKPWVPGVWEQPIEHEKLVGMLAGDRRAAAALVQSHLHGGRSIKWATDKAILDLERDRR
jgi:hypothetical protein